MFTGIIEEIGRIVAVAPSGDGVRLSVEAPKAVADARHGDSISISGVCLTVVDQNPAGFTADVMKQTLDMSTLGGLLAGAPGAPAAPQTDGPSPHGGVSVNVERAMTAGGRLGGHIVQGHIDGTGTILNVVPGAQWRVIRIGLPAHLAPLVVDKGSIAVDGVSLTVSAVSQPDAPAAWFEVSLIPETLQATTLGERAAGDRVNLETDILARHVERLLAFRGQQPTAAQARDPHAAAPAAATDPLLRMSTSFASIDVPPADYSILSDPEQGGSR